MRNTVLSWGLGTASAVLIGAGLISVGVETRVSEASPAPAVDPLLRLAGFISADQLETVPRQTLRAEVRRNETLSSVLDRLGAARDEANGAVYAAAEFVDLTRVRPGDNVTAWFEPGMTGELRLMGLSLRPDSERQVLVSRDLDGGWSTHELKAKLTPSHHRVAGTVQTSIYQAAVAQGANDQQVVDFADIFGYDIDFQREVQEGDQFEIFYETLDDELGQPVKSGAVLFASLNGQALKKDFYRFTAPDDGDTDYYDSKGQSVKKFLMKTPINGARLSSGFGNRRHPVLGYTKLHKGTDFAAPTGTPIYAAGNGVIEKYGAWSTFGNYARIQHANGYETAYAHMSRFAKGLKVGSRVRQGQIIGYVGTTGRSTGPHLHYEVHVNGKPVNAMALKLPTGRKLEGQALEAFKAEMAKIDALRTGGSTQPDSGPLVASAPGAAQSIATDGKPILAKPVAVAAPAPDRRPDSLEN